MVSTRSGFSSVFVALLVGSLASAAFAQSDSCASATAIGDGTFFGSTVGATNDGSVDCGQAAASPDVWYVYTATQDCRLRATTCGSSYDTVLSIHSGCPGTSGNELACNDDACGLQSVVTVHATTGTSYWIRVSGYAGATGSFQLDTSCTVVIPGTGPDIVIGELSSLGQLGRLGDVVGCGLQSTVCNGGSDPVDWVANPNPHHPFIVGNVYRMESGRFEQIGQSWAKHAFAAAQADECGFGCTPTGGTLGVGCSDTYGASLNGFQSILGPRAEINPWTGAFTYQGSYIQLHGGESFDAVEHRLRLHDADLDPAQHPGATYVVELYVLAHDDVDHTNSVGWEIAGVTGSPGGTWSFNLGGLGTHTGSAIDAWTGSTHTTFRDPANTDGRCYLAVRTSDNGNGTWHYEYALTNLDLDRQVGSISIPVSSETQITNPGFHAVEFEVDDGTSNAPWTFARTGSAVTWAAVPFAQDPNANSLRWGTTYSFRFDADAAPTEVTASLGLFKPGATTSLDGTTQGPTPRTCLAGTVNAGHGPLADVLIVNGGTGGATRTVDVALDTPITVSLASAPAGPSPGRYAFYVWRQPPTAPAAVVVRGRTLGCTANATPLASGATPQPFRCMEGGLPAAVCAGVSTLSGPASRAPWTRTHAPGFSTSITLTVQALLEDADAANSLGYSVSNGVVVSVHP
jgi:hypothetical protein